MSDHPSTDRLRLFQENLLGEIEAAAISDHLEGCESCQGILDDLPPFGEPNEPLLVFNGESTGPQIDTAPPELRGGESADIVHKTTAVPMRYRSLRLHASGGLGAVYVAEDTELHREVALKEIQAEFADDATSRGRFLLEAEITGRLEHPGVVPVYGLGQYSDGRPFYAMRFIQGDNLGEAIKRFHEAERPGRDPGERSLEFRQLLRRFIDVCNAVAYAHSRGVLHRDLKPSNVMLGKYGETLVVDWGLAKALGSVCTSSEGDGQLLRPSSGSGVAETRAGTFVGTPVYMSPEQAGGRIGEMGLASDVYSLGATLYVLLTGKPPFVGTDAQDLLNKVEHGHFSAPREVKADTPAALDAISRKAMALLPADRYATTLDLAADVEHWLADEPVTAYPEPWRTRFRRWLRRHRTLTASAAALLLTALVGLVIGLITVDQERRQTAQERDKKDMALQAETQARTIAMGALRKLTDDMVEQQLAGQTVLTEENRRFLREIQQQYEEFAALPGEEAERRAVRAEGHVRVGHVQRRLGDEKNAEASFRLALASYQQLITEVPASAGIRYNLASTYWGLGRLMQDTGRLREAETAYTSALGLMNDLAADFPTRHDIRHDSVKSHLGLANVFLATFRFKEAEERYNDALAIEQRLLADFPANTEFRQLMAGIQYSRGQLFRTTGQLKNAESAHAEALAIRKQLAADFPTRPEFRQNLAASHHTAGQMLYAMGRLEEAETSYRTALDIRRQLAADFPIRPEFCHDVAESHDMLGQYLHSFGRKKDAEAAYADALAIRQKLAADFPTRPEFRRGLAATYSWLGKLLAAEGRTDEAETAHGEALAIRKQLEAEFPTRSEFRHDLAMSFHDLAGRLRVQGRLKEAETVYGETLVIRKQLAADFPTVPNYQRELIGSHNDLAILFRKMGRPKDAERAYLEALAIQKQRVADSPNVPGIRYETALLLDNIAMLLNEGSDFAQARHWLEEAMPHHQAALQTTPKSPSYRELFRKHLAVLVESCAGLGDEAAALQAASQLRDLDWDRAVDAVRAADALANCVPVVRKNKQVSEAERAKSVQFYADQAMAMLREAVANGYKDVAQMKQNAKLAPLREREDFKQLIAGLESKNLTP